MRRLSVLLLLALAALAAARPSSQPWAAEAEPHLAAKAEAAEIRAGGKRTCLTAAETREQIKASHFIEPFAALKFASQHFKSEALSAKLCRIDDDYLYEISLLHRDGKYFHEHISALTGKIVEIRRPPKN
jgi:uncharacterized membrane protein YkoI